MHKYTVTHTPNFHSLGAGGGGGSQQFFFYTNGKNILRLYFTFALNLLISALKQR